MFVYYRIFLTINRDFFFFTQIHVTNTAEDLEFQFIVLLGTSE